MLGGPVQCEALSFYIWEDAKAFLANFTRCPWPWCRGRSQVALFRPDGPSMGLHHSVLLLSLLETTGRKNEAEMQENKEN